ncbi:hypothetical protein FB559_5008 [Actinoallomurus bryophytorum]|uniref:Uncharacterized protein n=1 Tax=Actinoallomurus bryophytorum TaxID=1490222 RepID=A0A543CQF3_9ACTN|nr:hypothetical protein FB559_5008 [Actinoallomurus bryophytorum]
MYGYRCRIPIFMWIDTLGCRNHQQSMRKPGRERSQVHYIRLLSWKWIKLVPIPLERSHHTALLASAGLTLGV